jgi:Kef-type K+ transport system membrane component KefB
MLDQVIQDLAGDLWFQVPLLLAVAVASSFLFVKLGLPKIVGQISLGIVLGPGVLGLVSIGNGDTENLLELLATFGVIIMLFMIGLEFDIKDIYTRNSALIAVGGIVLPWVGGYLLADLMLPDPGIGFDRLAQSVFVGTALVATSVAISAGILKEMRMLSSGVAKTILGAAVVDDVLGMVVLAISTGIAREGGVDFGNLVVVALAAVAFVAAGAFIGSRYLTKVVNKAEEKGLANGLPESGFLLALSIGFLYSFISRQLGISVIVGAFIAGASLSGCEYRLQLMRGMAFLEWVFAPIFFISLGALVNVRLPLQIWAFAGALAVVAILSKVVGGGSIARLLGMGSRESVAVGLGMSPRLEVAMIIGLFGLTEGIITTDVYSVIVITGLITVLTAPSLLKRSLRGFHEKSERPAQS